MRQSGQSSTLIKARGSFLKNEASLAWRFVIPLPQLAVEMFTELKLRACGSEYVLPSRRLAKQPHIGSDTLNRAIAKMFGKDPGKKKQPENLMGDIEYFRVHDLRRMHLPYLVGQLRCAWPCGRALLEPQVERCRGDL